MNGMPSVENLRGVLYRKFQFHKDLELDMNTYNRIERWSRRQDVQVVDGYCSDRDEAEASNKEHG